MKKALALAMALAMLLALTACGGNDAPAAPSEPASSPASVAEETSQPASEPEEEPEEEVEEEPVDVDAQMTVADNVISVVVDGQTAGTFTLPAENPLFPEITYNEGNLYAMIIHPVMEGVSGRTMIEVFEGSSQGYMDYGKSIVGLDDTAQTETKDLNGKEVLVCKQTEQTTNNFGDEVVNFKYLVSVPVVDGVALGFRIDGSYGTDNELVFDDSAIDLLLSSCVF